MSMVKAIAYSCLITITGLAIIYLYCTFAVFMKYYSNGVLWGLFVILSPFIMLLIIGIAFVIKE